MDTDELYALRAVELSDLISKKNISPVDIVKSLLERIDETNDHIKAFIHICRENAMADAREAETEMRRGDSKGLLHGIPVAYKDIYDVKGLPTTGGSVFMARYTAKADSAMAANLRKAGTICLGKLNTWEFASGGMELIGDAKNPWNTRMITGGSSAGSGAAVAASMVPLATGSDTGGSVRDPSALCGIVGLKPTFGRLSCDGIIPLSWSLDHPGPMTRTVADTALLFYGMAGEKMPDSPSAFLNRFECSMDKVRIGVPSHFFFDDLDAEVASAVTTAVSSLEKIGASVEAIELPFVKYGPAASYTIAYTESFAFHRDNFFKRSREYTLGFISKISGAAFLNASEHLTAERIRRLVTESFLTALSTVDIIITPMTAFPAYPIGSSPPQSHIRSFARPISLTGLPALSMPCGYTGSGLPIGMQMIARANDEDRLLRVAYAYEQSSQWHRRKPPVADGALWSPPALDEPRAEGVDAQWVMDAASRRGLEYVDSEMAEAIVPHVAPVKAMLAEAQERLKMTAPEALWARYLAD